MGKAPIESGRCGTGTYRIFRLAMRPNAKRWTEQVRHRHLWSKCETGSYSKSGVGCTKPARDSRNQQRRSAISPVGLFLFVACPVFLADTQRRTKQNYWVISRDTNTNQSSLNPPKMISAQPEARGR